jgi:hypothetical protein
MQTNHPYNSTELMLMIIKANLCNNKLIFGLEKAGVDAENFYGDLETVVLTLMGFDLKAQEDELFAFYYDKMNALLEIDVKIFRENLNRLAEEMYEALRRKGCEV